MKQAWRELGTLMATTMFVYTVFMRLLPPPLRDRIRRHTRKIIHYLYPYIRITFHEFTGENYFMRSEAYTAIQTYLSQHSSKLASRLKAEEAKSSSNTNSPLIFSMDDNEEIEDEFQGIKIKWVSNKITQKTGSFSWHPEEKRYYKLTLHRCYRDIIIGSYLNHVLEEARAIEMKSRELKLYANSKTKWSHIVFEHPARFETLAMDPKKKEEMVKDLVKFKKGKEYYKKVGKAWKRGYLLYGPPGTGKSTMVAAMANFMNYDVYDLELTAVKDNSELRKLLINTASKSIIVIEDIDCSLDLTGQRKNKKKNGKSDAREEGKGTVKRSDGEEDEKGSKVTLSGLLNIIDGIWSACGGEKIMIFTTNFVEKLDPALIRRGRMDKHIELSYCRYEAFKILAKNYLDLEYHNLFPTIEKLLEMTNMTPADVAENLMPKSLDEGVDTCLCNLVQALEKSKQDSNKVEINEKGEVQSTRE
ncbi:AAA-ATPase At3g28580-like [Arachis stenosperma]|uniref:AAA-ATPase At3g28580-like n=1 Tax=Arachis stenosperma TaxID=217475 RepID=UPI0025AD2133|nr:AAA-ATPase At3g28580-like [Arachis stenosperma]